MANKKIKKKDALPAYLMPDHLTESYLLTISRRSFGMYAERLLDLLILAAKQETTGVFSGSILSCTQESDDARKIEFSVRHLLANNIDHNYATVEQTLSQMSQFHFQIRSEEDHIFRDRQLITDVTVDEDRHVCSIRVQPEVWDALRKRDGTIRVFNPNTAYKLTSGHTYHLYKLISKQKNPITYHIEEVKKMLGCEGKYKRLNDFVSRVLEPAVADLKSSADWYFEYELKISVERLTQRKKGRPSYDLITFFPKRNISQMSTAEQGESLQIGGKAADALPMKIKNYLNYKYDFSDTEIKSSRVILQAYDVMTKNREDMLQFLYDNTEVIDGARDKKAYVVGLLKNHLWNKYNIPSGSEKSYTKLVQGGSSKRGSNIGTIGDLLKK